MKSSIKERNLFPVWNESFLIDLKNIDYKSRVIVTVFDHDSIGSGVVKYRIRDTLKYFKFNKIMKFSR